MNASVCSKRSGSLRSWTSIAQTQTTWSARPLQFFHPKLEFVIQSKFWDFLNIDNRLLKPKIKQKTFSWYQKPLHTPCLSSVGEQSLSLFWTIQEIFFSTQSEDSCQQSYTQHSHCWTPRAQSSWWRSPPSSASDSSSGSLSASPRQITCVIDFTKWFLDYLLLLQLVLTFHGHFLHCLIETIWNRN